MLTTVKGIYRQGQVELKEQPAGLPEGPVLVTFLVTEEAPSAPRSRAQIVYGQFTIAGHVEPGRGHQRGQAQQEILGLEAPHVAPVGQAALHLVEHGAVVGATEAALAQRRAQAIAGQALETGAVVVVDGGGGVHDFLAEGASVSRGGLYRCARRAGEVG